ncbi:MAG: hypothetical protein A2W38_00145 [Deltaproteobacteria bacterium RBG_19FT_COMBO_58_16]|nr:MAG: hypothetical protein A2W38_00145 [Deltaproteobacteria bacterium RBG_19FT_COMBO_58_16]
MGPDGFELCGVWQKTQISELSALFTSAVESRPKLCFVPATVAHEADGASSMATMAAALKKRRDACGVKKARARRAIAL